MQRTTRPAGDQVLGFTALIADPERPRSIARAQGSRNNSAQQRTGTGSGTGIVLGPCVSWAPGPAPTLGPSDGVIDLGVKCRAHRETSGIQEAVALEEADQTPDLPRHDPGVTGRALMVDA